MKTQQPSRIWGNFFLLCLLVLHWPGCEPFAPTRGLALRPRLVAAHKSSPSTLHPLAATSSSSLASPPCNATAEASQNNFLVIPHHHGLGHGLGHDVWQDISARRPDWLTDWKDGCNGQAASTVAFLTFACLAPAVGFGGLYSVATGGQIGVVEALTSTAVSGSLYALTSAQPAAIVGATGPLFAYAAALYALAQRLSLPFLPLYAWTGLWTSGLLATIALTGASKTVRNWTRFTDDIFSTLVSVIFITQAAQTIWRLATVGSASVGESMVTAACAAVAYSLTTLLKTAKRRKHWEPPALRQAVSNLAPTLGVAAACTVAAWARVRHGITLAALALPTHFGTTVGRAWRVPLLDLPVWARWAALLPATMATLVIFFEHAITHRLLNSPRYKLRKGRSAPQASVVDGMHEDTMVLAALTALQSLCGLPWLTAATVRSVAHVQALQTQDGALEQRVTNVAIHAVLGALVVFSRPRQWLTQTVPPAALMGLVSAMSTALYDLSTLQLRGSHLKCSLLHISFILYAVSLHGSINLGIGQCTVGTLHENGSTVQVPGIRRAQVRFQSTHGHSSRLLGHLVRFDAQS